MRIDGFRWKPWIIDKIISEHRVTPNEAEEAVHNNLEVRKARDGALAFYGRTNAGRYLFVVGQMIVFNGLNLLKVITAYEMSASIKSKLKRNRK